MFTDLNVFKMAFAMASHAGQRQALVAQNMANADTPGYKSRDLQDFKSAFGGGPAGEGMRATRDGHIGPNGETRLRWTQTENRAGLDPNENNVSLEGEMLRAVDVKRQHDRALSVYKSSLGILRTSLGRS